MTADPCHPGPVKTPCFWQILVYLSLTLKHKGSQNLVIILKIPDV